MAVKFHIDFPLFPREKTKTTLESIYLKGDKSNVIFLVHGLTGTPNEMRFLARQFNAEGMTVFCPLLYNHGQSLKVLKYCHWQDFYSHLKNDFISFQRTHSEAKIFVSGLSVGALLALTLAYDFPDIAGVIALAPTLFYDGWNMPWIRILLPLVYLSPLKYCFYFKEEPPYGIKSKVIRQHVENYYKKARLDDLEGVAKYGYPFIPTSLMQQLDKLAKYLMKKLPFIKVPLQLIQAENDDLASVKNSQFIYQNIGSEDKELVLLKDSYHVITADKERGKVFDFMKNFISRHNFC